MTEPEVDVCCQEFDKCLRPCTPRGQWIAHKAAQREWQGLTDEEVDEAYAGGMHVLFGDVNKGFARAIEAKLKEKNNG